MVLAVPVAAAAIPQAAAGTPSCPPARSVGLCCVVLCGSLGARLALPRLAPWVPSWRFPDGATHYLTQGPPLTKPPLPPVCPPLSVCLCCVKLGLASPCAVGSVLSFVAFSRSGCVACLMPRFALGFVRPRWRFGLCGISAFPAFTVSARRRSGGDRGRRCQARSCRWRPSAR